MWGQSVDPSPLNGGNLVHIFVSAGPGMVSSRLCRKDEPGLQRKWTWVTWLKSKLCPPKESTFCAPKNLLSALQEPARCPPNLYSVCPNLFLFPPYLYFGSSSSFLCPPYPCFGYPISFLCPPYLILWLL